MDNLRTDIFIEFYYRKGNKFLNELNESYMENYRN